MTRALLKDTFREIGRSFSRFLSIFFIVLIGVSFFAGIKATCPDMKLTADRYFDDYSLMDIRIVSTMGLTDDDADAVRKISGVESVAPTYSMDALIHVEKRDLVVKVLAWESPESPAYTGINGAKLVEGRWPRNSGECLAERGRILNPVMSVGSKLTLASGTDEDISESLKNSEFTIVGIVETPYYISYERGLSAIGNGKVNSFILIPRDNFKLDFYTDIYLTVENTKELLCYDDAYEDAVETVETALEDLSATREIARREEIVAKANETLAERKKELADAEETQRTELKDAQKKLDDAKKDIQNGEKEIADNEKKLDTEIKKARSKLNAGYAELAKGEKEYKKQHALYLQAKKLSAVEFPAAEEKIAAGEAELKVEEAALAQLKYLLANDPTLTEEQKAAYRAQIAEGEQMIAAARAELEAARAELAAKKKELSDAQSALKKTRKLLDDSRKKLNAGKAKLSRTEKDTRKELDDAKKKLADAKKQYAGGQKEYDDAKKESDEKIADARAKIADAEKKISEIKMPEWYVLDRNTNPGFADYSQAADRMDAIAQVFPVFFILVTALVCLTTMTRMVDEQRTLIGTLKALGYSKAAIAAKYLLYAAIASITGSVAGVFLGFYIFPTVIGNAYAIMYTLPKIRTDFNPLYAAVSMVFAVFTTTLTAWAACYQELKASPAALMRPKAPRPGKRVFLEYIPFLWSKLNFSRKITVRNIFRYKRRFAMTVLGIAGCTALVLSGFGLKDSITSIASKQFEEIYRYNMVVDLKDEAGSDIEIEKVLSQDIRVTDYLLACEKNITIKKDKTEKTVTLLIPQSEEKFKSFIRLRDRVTGADTAFTGKSVLLTEKLAAMLKAVPGDRVEIDDGDRKRSVAVTGITENYLSHFVYMSPAVYSEAFTEDFDYRKVYAKTAATDADFENALSTGLIREEGVSSVGFTTNISRDFNDVIQSLYYVVLVLIVSAGTLAIVVLYNLTNINIMERLREIATIKVLGFYDLEVSAYVFWENVILTLFGMVFGVGLGIYLHKFVVVTAEVDMVMFGREIFFMSYLYSILLTVFFTGIVNFAMFFRLRGIDMVESLKSVD